MIDRKFRHKYVIHYTYVNKLGQVISSTSKADSRVPIVQNYEKLQDGLCKKLEVNSVFIQNITSLNRRMR